jgi:LysR family transcriptional regulator, mexEF-oprN operon transcriptional activator
VEANNDLDVAGAERPFIQDIEIIDHFNLRNFDLNLMLVFDALMKERSVTKAAVKLRIQQPAMSYSLSTLRLLLQDELFVRVGQTMRPTPRAHALAAGISRVLSEAHRLLLTSRAFDPSQEERTFHIGCYSEIEVILIPELAAHLRQHASGIRIHARNTSPEMVFRMLDDQRIDFAVGCFPESHSRFRSKELFGQSLMCCYNPKLLRFPRGLRLKDYTAARHALVSQSDGLEGCLDQVLKLHDLRIDVAVAAPEFLSILAAVARAPFLATLPAWIVNRFAGLFGLETCEAPFEHQLPPVVMLWPSHVDKEAASEWIREQLTQVIASNQDLV